MISCREFLDFLVDHFEGGLPAAQQAEFDRHLAVCPECVAYLESYRRTIELGSGLAADGSLEPSEAPARLIAAILAARRRGQS